MLFLCTAQDEADAATVDGAGFQLPLYADEWVEELLSRIFATLSNLENPNHGDDSARVSFLLEGNSMFRCAPASLSPALLAPSGSIREPLRRYNLTKSGDDGMSPTSILCIMREAANAWGLLP